MNLDEAKELLKANILTEDDLDALLTEAVDAENKQLKKALKAFMECENWPQHCHTVDYLNATPKRYGEMW